MERFRERLEAKGVEFYFLRNVEDILIQDEKAYGVRTKKEEIESKNVIIAPGRSGNQWFEKIAKQNDIKLTHLPIDIGVRLETLDILTKPITDIQYCPKIRTRYNDALVRNFCTNPQGFVVTENFEDFKLVNGHSEKTRKSENCNFAILYRTTLTSPSPNTREYGELVARLCNSLGQGQPIVQRLHDLKEGKRSKEGRINFSHVTPTLEEAVPGNLKLALPSEILDGIMHYLKGLEILMPGIYKGGNTLLYGPEIKFQSMRGAHNQNLESTVENLFLAGDGCGLTGGIVQAAVTGILAAEGIIKKQEK